MSEIKDNDKNTDELEIHWVHDQLDELWKGTVRIKGTLTYLTGIYKKDNGTWYVCVTWLNWETELGRLTDVYVLGKAREDFGAISLEEAKYLAKQHMNNHAIQNNFI